MLCPVLSGTPARPLRDLPRLHQPISTSRPQLSHRRTLLPCLVLLRRRSGYSFTVYRLPIGTILTIEQCESAPDGILGLKSVPFRLDGGSGDNFYKHFFFSVSMANIAAWACRTTNLVLRLSWRTQAPQCEIGTFATNITVNTPPF